MTRQELSLLLYVEARAVDHSGATDSRQMNDEDRVILEEWNRTGFVRSGRIASDFAQRGSDGWVRLSDEAFAAAHAERHARSKRLWESRKWLTTAEKRGEQ